MKTVLFVTSEPAHRVLYGQRLEKYFHVEFSGKTGGEQRSVDAVVYDIPSLHSTVDVRWLKELDLPVVVLTCERKLRVSENPKRRILSYPVKMDQIIRALIELGVAGEDS